MKKPEIKVVLTTIGGVVMSLSSAWEYDKK
jgi:hypothetical protein